MIRIEGLTKVYGMGDIQVHALRGVDLAVGQGEMVAVMGPSGSGKSTLMNMIGCLDRPSAGKYVLAGNEVSTMNDNQLADVRNRHIGFIFQGFHLLSRLTAVQNVETPLVYRGVPAQSRRRLALEALDRVGLKGRAEHRPPELSGGQQQRVAIARAIAGNPSILLGDEPTGALDQRTGHEILHLFQQLHAEGATLVVVTHDETVAAHCSRVVRLSDGRVLSDQVNPNPRIALTELAKLPVPPANDEQVAAAAHG